MSDQGLAVLGYFFLAWVLGYCLGAGLKYYERFIEKAVQ